MSPGLWSQAFRGGRLPNGEDTSDEELYHSSWRELADFLETAFPGYTVVCCNPGFMLSHPDVRSGPLMIGTHAALALRSSFAASRSTKEKKGGKR